MVPKLEFSDVKKFIEADGNNTLISDIYIDSKTKMTILCLTCNQKYQMDLCHYRQGNRCNKRCRWIKTANARRKHNVASVTQFMAQFKEKLISTTYTNPRTHLDVQCHKCDGIYKITFDHFKNGNRCGLCVHNRKKTINDIKNYIENQNDTLISTEYVNDRALLDIMCHNCKQIYRQCWHEYRMGRHCQTCFGPNRYDDHVIHDIVEMGGDKFIGPFTKASERFKVQCLKCNNEYMALLDTFKRGSRCPPCGQKAGAKKLLLSINYVKSYIEDCGEILISEDFPGTHKPIKIKCHNCFEIYEKTLIDFREGSRCNKCSGKRSTGEVRIATHLKRLGLSFKQEMIFDNCINPETKRKLRYDFYVTHSKYTFCIEYHGIQHFQVVEIFGGKNGFEGTRKRDNIKLNYCLMNKIPIIIIPYSHFNQIESMIDEYLIKLDNRKTAQNSNVTLNNLAI